MSELVRRPTAVFRARSEPEAGQRAAREFLTFSLADEAYGFPLVCVREILRLPPLTPVPRSSRFVLGVVSVRGMITTVVDLRRLLRVEARGLEGPARLLLLDVGGEVVGALVDRVFQVHRLAADEVELAQAAGGDFPDYVTGIGRPRGRNDGDPAGRDLIVLLDPEPLLARIERS